MSSQRRTPAKGTVDWVKVGRRIRELRGFDMTQEDFAKRAGITQAYLSNVERGRVEVGAAILLRISQEFDKSIEWLLTGEERVLPVTESPSKGVVGRLGKNIT